MSKITFIRHLFSFSTLVSQYSCLVTIWLFAVSSILSLSRTRPTSIKRLSLGISISLIIQKPSVLTYKSLRQVYRVWLLVTISNFVDFCCRGFSIGWFGIIIAIFTSQVALLASYGCLTFRDWRRWSFWGAMVMKVLSGLYEVRQFYEFVSIFWLKAFYFISERFWTDFNWTLL